jgi:hypothetical protein
MRSLRAPLRAAVLLGGLLATAGALWAQAPAAPQSTNYSISDVMVAPTRIVFDGPKRTAEVALINQSDKTLTYRISFVRMRMLESGALQEITETAAEERFVDDLVRFTPRQVILEPKKTQVIRLQLRKPADLPEGEYRSHLLFRVVPPLSPEAAPSAEEAKGISIQLIPVYGVSIPVIVRQGTLSAKVQLTELVVQPATPTSPLAVKMQLQRSGTQSLFGDIEIEWVVPNQLPLVVGRANGVAIYTPNASRQLTVGLQVPKERALRGGHLQVRYMDPLEGRRGVFAEASVAIP